MLSRYEPNSACRFEIIACAPLVATHIRLLLCRVRDFSILTQPSTPALLQMFTRVLVWRAILSTFIPNVLAPLGCCSCSSTDRPTAVRAHLVQASSIVYSMHKTSTRKVRKRQTHLKLLAAAFRCWRAEVPRIWYVVFPFEKSI